jgi:hypothetical protein
MLADDIAGMVRGLPINRLESAIDAHSPLSKGKFQQPVGAWTKYPSQSPIGARHHGFEQYLTTGFSFFRHDALGFVV